MKKETLKTQEAKDLWSQDQEAQYIPLSEYKELIADTEKLLIMGETGSGKTKFYIDIFRYWFKRGLKPEDFLACIILPDRPTGVTKLADFIPKSYLPNIRIQPVSKYEDLIRASSASIRQLTEHYEKRKKYGFLIYELLENNWTFAQDYFCRNAYGKTMGEFFAQMQNIMGADKGDKRTAYEAFAGPFGGPWPIIKFFHNFNWIDKIKVLPFNTIFTSELKEETNKDSIFFELGFRPAGEKHNQHKVDSIVYTSHTKDDFFIRSYKLTGYTRLYGKTKVTGKNDYQVHLDCLKELENRGFKVAPIDDIAMQAGVIPPKKKEEKPKESKKVEKEESDWDISLE